MLDASRAHATPAGIANSQAQREACERRELAQSAPGECMPLGVGRQEKKRVDAASLGEKIPCMLKEREREV
jgi:hypothetical protein